MPPWRPNIAYFLSGVADLKYAVRAGDTWTIETADGAALNSGNYNSLAIDELGNPHISTFDNDNLNLRYTIDEAKAARQLAGRVPIDGRCGVKGRRSSQVEPVEDVEELGAQL